MDHQNSQTSLDYQRIEKAINFLENNFREQPELTELSSHVGLSEFHFQKMFKRWVGISPKRFLQYLTKEHAKTLLARSRNILEVTYDSGLSSPGRLHDLFIQCEALTPGEYKNSGAGVDIYYGVHETHFGTCLMAMTNRGICGLFFLQDDNREKYLERLRREWKAARITEDVSKTGAVVNSIFSPLDWRRNRPFQLFLRGTNFQLKVWEALMKIPEGLVVSYEDIAKQIGSPGAVRAVGSAVARNPISYLIPCHRVIRKLGSYGNYQGGTARKKAILAWESARTNGV